MSLNGANGNIREESFKDALSERYLNYAVSTIMSRSLPDVRDGLKPVHRRLLYAMLQLRLNPEQGFKKCARIVGDVMGKYHPHGDQAIYDALVRLAQQFSVRYPLIDGQGNFGNIDGDNAAAMRYTESRLTETAISLLEGIEQDSVDFRDTYDGDSSEPIVLPANFPNLLANGASGIAVGMASSIPPHNVCEIYDAALHLLKTPNATITKLVSFISGPDFPTGGILVENKNTLVEAYSQGKGSFRIRSKWEVENLAHGQYQVVITEIPYLVQKSRLIEKIADLLQQRKLLLLSDVRDESADDIRLVLEPKNRNVDPELLMESLFRTTELESRFNLNMNVIDSNQNPRVMSLREVLQAFIDHRHDILIRSNKYKLNNIIRRLEILNGYMIVYLNLDEVIRVIREEEDPKSVFKIKWDLSDVQSDAILNMRLRSLRRLEELSIKTEITNLKSEKKLIKHLLENKKKRLEHISDEFKTVKKQYNNKTSIGKRRTIIGEAPKEVDISTELVIEKEEVTVVCSQKGWVRTIKGHELKINELKYKEGDKERFIIKALTTDKLILFASDGRFFTLEVNKLPGGRGHGEPISLMIDLGNETELVNVLTYHESMKLVISSDTGRGFIVPEKDVVAQTRAGKKVLFLDEGAESHICRPINGDHIALIGTNRKLLIFPIEEVPIMSKGKGVRLQNYTSGRLADLTTFFLEQGLMVRTGNRNRTFSSKEIVQWSGKRAQTGRLPPAGFPRSNVF
jgi:topoisomerase-4 subunit A